MKLTLKPEFEKFVDEKVKSRQYANPTEVIEDALSVLRKQEEFSAEHKEYMRGGLAKAVAQADRGEFVECTAKSVIEEQLAKRAKQGQ